MKSKDYLDQIQIAEDTRLTVVSNYGQKWSYKKRLAMCGCVIGEYLDTSGLICKQHFWCKQYADCERCCTYRAEQMSKDLFLAIHTKKHANLKLELRKSIVLDDGDGRALKNFTKKVRYAGGVYKRLPVEDGVYILVSMVPAANDNDKFGSLVEPEIVYYDNKPYETYENAMKIDFEEIVVYCKQANKRATGTLKPIDTTNDNMFLLRFSVVIPKNKSNLELKQEIDDELQNPIYVNEFTESIPMSQVADNVELQIALDNLAEVYRRKYFDAGVDFSTIAKFIMVPVSEFEKWNHRVCLNRGAIDFNPDKSDFVSISRSINTPEVHNTLLPQIEIMPRFEFIDGVATLVS
jgi:hypothetical protein